jgi:hypothetical protein
MIRRMRRIMRMPPVNVWYQAVQKVQEVIVCPRIQIHNGQRRGGVLHEYAKHAFIIRQGRRDLIGDVDDLSFVLG